MVAVDQAAVRVIALGDQVRVDAAEAAAAMRAAGLGPVRVTGDSDRAAGRVAK